MAQVVIGIDKGASIESRGCGPDSVIFGSAEKTRVKRNGRPRLDRNLSYRLLLAGRSDPKKKGYSTQYIKRAVGCSDRSVRMMRKELEKIEVYAKDGSIPEEIAEKLKEENLRVTIENVNLALRLLGNVVEVDVSKIEKRYLTLDQESMRATGISFKDWMLSLFKKKSTALAIYRFIEKVWDQIWGKPSLFLLKDMTHALGDEVCLNFKKEFGSDTKRIRRRLTMIRYLFRFLGRTDLLDRHLKIRESKHPRAKRTVPEITFMDYPPNLDLSLRTVGKLAGPVKQLSLELKLCTLMRTGERGSQGQELADIRVGVPEGTYLIMNSPDEYSFRIKAKENLEWSITWIPRRIRLKLWDHYQKKNPGDYLFEDLDKRGVEKLRKVFGDVTEKIIGRRLILHDLRKTCLTWLYVMGIRLEVATSLNVGWKDLNTARDFYLQFGLDLPKSKKLEYRKKIPEWFKEGLEEYIEDEERTIQELQSEISRLTSLLSSSTGPKMEDLNV